MMSRAAFLIALRQTPGTWHLEALGTIRCDGQCPIQRTYRAHGYTDWASAGYRLGLSNQDADAIMDAADNRTTHDPILRGQLLAATVERHARQFRRGDPFI